VTRIVAPALLFAAPTLVMAAPWSLHPASRVLVDGPDTHLLSWTLRWDAHAIPPVNFLANLSGRCGTGGTLPNRRTCARRTPFTRPTATPRP